MLRLVVDPHVVGDVRRRQQLPTYVTRHLLLVTDQVCTEAVPRGKRRRARLRRTRGGALVEAIGVVFLLSPLSTDQQTLSVLGKT